MNIESPISFFYQLRLFISSNNSPHPTHHTSLGLHHREIFSDFTNFKYSCKACSQNHEFGFDGKVVYATILVLTGRVSVSGDCSLFFLSPGR